MGGAGTVCEVVPPPPDRDAGAAAGAAAPRRRPGAAAPRAREGGEPCGARARVELLAFLVAEAEGCEALLPAARRKPLRRPPREPLREVRVWGARHVVWAPCHAEEGDGGALALARVVLGFLGLARRVEQLWGPGLVGVHLDARGLPGIGDVSGLLPLDVHVAAALAALLEEERSAVAPRWVQDPFSGRLVLAGDFPRGSQACQLELPVWPPFAGEGPWPLAEAALEEGRALCRRHLRIAPAAARILEQRCAEAGAAGALGVHVSARAARAPAGARAGAAAGDGGWPLCVAEAANTTARVARALGVTRALLAGDDARFLAALQRALAERGVDAAPAWPGSSRGWGAGAGPAAAADCLAGSFVLSRCRGLLGAHSGAAVWAALWAAPGCQWHHFRAPPAVGGDMSAA